MVLDAIMKQYLILIHIGHGRYSHNFSVLPNEYLEMHSSTGAPLCKALTLSLYQTHSSVYILLSVEAVNRK